MIHLVPLTKPSDYSTNNHTNDNKMSNFDTNTNSEINKDLNELYNMRNHPDVRKWSFNTSELDKDEFKSKYQTYFQNGIDPMFIVTDDNEIIGYLGARLVLDKIGYSNKFEISVIIKPKYQGHGFARRALIKYELHIINNIITSSCNYKADLILVANIHKHNIASQRLFTGLGYEYSVDHNGFNNYVKLIELEKFHIGDHKLDKPYVIAELSANHNGNIDTAIELVRAAGQTGANAIKLQTYTADTITIDCDREDFIIKGGLWNGMKLYDLYKKAYTPWEWYPTLKAEAEKYGMDIFSSPFDTTAVDFLEDQNVPVYKVASCEMKDHTLLRKIAETGKPVIMSTGMATINEVEESYHTLISYGCPSVCILKCTAAYPAKIEETNLNGIEELQKRFKHATVGLSDHTLGSMVPIISIAKGAMVVEKHFTLDREGGSPDDPFSLTPEEFTEMVKSVHTTYAALGTGELKSSYGEKSVKKLRRSLYVVEDVKAGDTVTSSNVRSIRPGGGIQTRHYYTVLGKKFIMNICRGTPLQFEYFE